MERPLYINWIVDEEGITFEDGKPLKCYKLSYENDEKVFDDWALHIRKHYIEDDELIEDSTITGLGDLAIYTRIHKIVTCDFCILCSQNPLYVEFVKGTQKAINSRKAG